MSAAAEKLVEPYLVVCDTSDEKAWLAARNTGIGASETAIILGASEWGSVLELYYRKTGEVDLPVEESELMLWGKRLEAAIRDETAARAGVERLPGSRLLRSSVYPWALATPDALTTNGEPVEVKNISHGFDKDEWEEQIPEKYFLQCQKQMLVTGASRCLFGALLWGSRLIWEWVPRNESVIASIVAAESEFWDRVERRDPPLSDGHPNARTALAKLAVVEDGIELFESEIASNLERYEQTKAAHEAAAAAEKKAKRQLEAEKDEIAKTLGEVRSGFTATGWDFRWKKVARREYTVAATTYEQFEIKPPKE